MQGPGNLRSLAQSQVLLAVELLLQLQELVAGEGRPAAAGLGAWPATPAAVDIPFPLTGLHLVIFGIVLQG